MTCLTHGGYCRYEQSNQISLDELDRDGGGDDSRAMAFVEQAADGFAAARTVIQGPFIDVHAYEAIGQRLVHVARVAQGVSQCIVAVIQAVLDALFQESTNQ